LGLPPDQRYQPSGQQRLRARPQGVAGDHPVHDRLRRQRDLVVDLDDLFQVLADVGRPFRTGYRDAGEHAQVAAEDESDAGQVEVELDRLADLDRGPLAAAVEVVDEHGDRPLGPADRLLEQFADLIPGLRVPGHTLPQVVDRPAGADDPGEDAQPDADGAGDHPAAAQLAHRPAHDARIQPVQDQPEHAVEGVGAAGRPGVEPDHLDLPAFPQGAGELPHHRALAGTPAAVDREDERGVAP